MRCLLKILLTARLMLGAFSDKKQSEEALAAHGAGESRGQTRGPASADIRSCRASSAARRTRRQPRRRAVRPGTARRCDAARSAATPRAQASAAPERLRVRRQVRARHCRRRMDLRRDHSRGDVRAHLDVGRVRGDGHVAAFQRQASVQRRHLGLGRAARRGGCFDISSEVVFARRSRASRICRGCSTSPAPSTSR